MQMLVCARVVTLICPSTNDGCHKSVMQLLKPYSFAIKNNHSCFLYLLAQQGHRNETI